MKNNFIEIEVLFGMMVVLLSLVLFCFYNINNRINDLDVKIQLVNHETTELTHIKGDFLNNNMDSSFKTGSCELQCNFDFSKMSTLTTNITVIK